MWVSKNLNPQTIQIKKKKKIYIYIYIASSLIIKKPITKQHQRMNKQSNSILYLFDTEEGFEKIRGRLFSSLGLVLPTATGKVEVSISESKFPQTL